MKDWGISSVDFNIKRMNPNLFFPLKTSGPEYDGDDIHALTVYDLGDIHLLSGQVAVCDPFITLGQSLVVSCPVGTFPVKVTVADVSEQQDGSHCRDAYLSIIFSPEDPVSFQAVYPDSYTKKQRAQTPYLAIGVDSGTVGFVDAAAAARFVTDAGKVELEEQINSADPYAWRNLMKNPHHYREGSANIVLPTAQNQENVCLTTSGWGNGAYPVIGGFNAQGALISLHIDLLIVGAYRYETDDNDE